MVRHHKWKNGYLRIAQREDPLGRQGVEFLRGASVLPLNPLVYICTHRWKKNCQNFCYEFCVSQNLHLRLSKPHWRSLPRQNLHKTWEKRSTLDLNFPYVSRFSTGSSLETVYFTLSKTVWKFFVNVFWKFCFPMEKKNISDRFYIQTVFSWFYYQNYFFLTSKLLSIIKNSCKISINARSTWKHF